MQYRTMGDCCAAVLVALLWAAPVSAVEFPSWAYPGCPAKPGSDASDDRAPRSVPGSAQHYTVAEIHTRSQVHDWFPGEHPTPPAAVTRNRSPERYACGFCHLPDGTGRPENAKLAGLPAAYILAQVKALRGHERHAALADWLPTSLMVTATQDLTDAELANIADYFSRLPARSYVRVVEQATAPAHETACFTYAPAAASTTEPATSIVEMPTDMSRFELRDPHVAYDAYVPPGSIARGRVLAESGGDGVTQPCATCHGAGLRGDRALPGPPLAGRFPTYLYRQLHGIQAGARGGATAAPMVPVVAHLSSRDMIDLAAYAASLPP